MEDDKRFQVVLDGVHAWRPKRAAYRRCYFGLVGGYFGYDAMGLSTPESGQRNWQILRSYLAENLGTFTDKVQPRWVQVLDDNNGLLSDEPCRPYAQSLLDGERESLEELYRELPVSDASWFARELMFEQIRIASAKVDSIFRSVLPGLLEQVVANKAHGHAGLARLVDRYADSSEKPVHPRLRDEVVGAWGNPWLPSSQKKWALVTDSARSMIAEWLKLEFIETFFTKLADDGVGDTRRLEFWKRYLASIENIQFGLGPTAFNSRSPDFLELKRKMKGLITEIRGSGSDNNAFIMTMGPVVIVEFGSKGNAMYAYSTSEDLPFELDRPFVLTVDGKNSLKHSHHKAKWGHKDNVHGWARWEEMFEYNLKRHFALVPGKIKAPTAKPAATKVQVRASNPQPAVVENSAMGGDLDSQWAAGAAAMKDYSLTALKTFAKGASLHVDDRTGNGGSLWVLTDDDTDFVNSVLSRWGFRYAEGKGWWRKKLHD